MVRLRLLGNPSIESAAGKPAEALPAQPKRLAVLAYIAVAGEAPLPRDTLLGMFWPDSDTEHARASLRQAIHFIRSNIRSSLGTDILAPAGSDDLSLRRDLVWCDALEFEGQIAAGDGEGALSLYRGNFLEGLYVTGAPQFEHWLETQRIRFRTAAELACARAAEDELAKGNLRGALFWANRGEVIAPTNERLLRMIITLNDKLGDRAGAIAKFTEFASWLRDEHLLEPSAETVALVETFRRSRKTPGSNRRTTPTENMGAILTYRTPSRPHAAIAGSATAEPAAKATPSEPGQIDYRELTEGALDAIYTVNASGQLESANAAVTNLLGLTLEELRARPLTDLVLEEFRDAAIQFYARQLRQMEPTSYYELPVRTATGRTMWIGQILHVIDRGHGKIRLHGVARDITAQRGMRRTRSMLGWRDPATGLYNEEAFNVLAEHRRALAAETGMPLAFLAVSLANLSQIEAEKGDTEAEHALLLTAQALQETFRKSDVIAHVARNRFVVLGSDWNGVGVGVCISRLRERIAQRAAVRLGFTLSMVIDSVSDDITPGRGYSRASKLSA